MIQPGFFDSLDRLHKIDKNVDPLAKLNEAVIALVLKTAPERVPAATPLTSLRVLTR